MARQNAFVLTDSGAFSGRWANFSISLLENTSISIPPEVAAELGHYATRPPKTAGDEIVTRALRERFYPKSSLRIMDTATWPRTIQRAFAHYLNLLKLRRAPPLTPELGRELQKVGVGTTALTKKATPGGTFADETVVAMAFFLAAYNKRPVYVLTSDEDVMLQAYKLMSLMWDDYFSLLLANDYRKHPFLYGTPIPLSGGNIEGFCLPIQSYAVSRAGVSPYALVPRITFDFNISFVNLATDTPAAFLCNMPPGIDRMIDVRGRTQFSTIDTFGSLSCHHQVPGIIPSPPLSVRFAPYMFFLRDRFLSIPSSPVPVSMIDYFRSLVDVEQPTLTEFIAAPL